MMNPTSTDSVDALVLRGTRAGGRESIGLLILRLTVGAILVEHGIPKLMHPSSFVRVVGSLGVPLPTAAAWLELLGEVGLGLLLVLGLFTQIAGILTAVMMGLVWITVHMPKGWSSEQGVSGEFALLLAVLGAVLALSGAGAWSVDAVL